MVFHNGIIFILKGALLAPYNFYTLLIHTLFYRLDLECLSFNAELRANVTAQVSCCHIMPLEPARNRFRVPQLVLSRKVYRHALRYLYHLSKWLLLAGLGI